MIPDRVVYMSAKSRLASLSSSSAFSEYHLRASFSYWESGPDSAPYKPLTRPGRPRRGRTRALRTVRRWRIRRASLAVPDARAFGAQCREQRMAVHHRDFPRLG